MPSGYGTALPVKDTHGLPLSMATGPFVQEGKFTAAHSTLPELQGRLQQDFGFGKWVEFPASKPFKTPIHSSWPPGNVASPDVSATLEAAGDPVCLLISLWHQKNTGG